MVVPVVAGSSVLGCWLGFQELYNADAISQLPLAGAALSQLLSTSTISPGDTTVVLLSGSGLKAALKVAELTGSVSASTAKEFNEVCSVTATVVEGLEASIFQSVDVFQPARRPIPALS